MRYGEKDTDKDNKMFFCEVVVKAMVIRISVYGKKTYSNIEKSVCHQISRIFVDSQASLSIKNEQ